MSNKRSIAEIKAILEQINDKEDVLLKSFQDDERKGVKSLVSKTLKRIDNNQLILKEHHNRLQHEKTLKSQGYQMIAGIDEVGRGPLAGPLVTAAVILPDDCSELIGVNDSKQLSAVKRQEFVARIKAIALCYSITVTSSEVIDQVNIYEATRQSMLESVNNLSIKPDYLLIDAMRLDTTIPQTSLIKGDANSLSIAAASILAKEYRDELMKDYAKKYPEFGFEKHMGYGTKQHLEALNNYGITPIHRRSFSPVSQTKKIYFPK